MFAAQQSSPAASPKAIFDRGSGPQLRAHPPSASDNVTLALFVAGDQLFTLDKRTSSWQSLVNGSMFISGETLALGKSVQVPF